MVCGDDPAFNGIGMNYVGSSIHYDSTTSFFGKVLILISGVHVLLGEVAVLVLKSRVVHGEELAKDLTFDLLHKIIDGVSIDERSFFCIMSVQVKIKRKSVLANK